MTVFPDPPRKSPLTVTLAEPGEDVELKAIAFIASVLAHLDADQQQRVIAFISGRMKK